MRKKLSSKMETELALLSPPATPPLDSIKVSQSTTFSLFG